MVAFHPEGVIWPQVAHPKLLPVANPISAAGGAVDRLVQFAGGPALADFAAR
jgi:hypothetical protein